MPVTVREAGGSARRVWRSGWTAWRRAFIAADWADSAARVALSHVCCSLPGADACSVLITTTVSGPAATVCQLAPQGMPLRAPYGTPHSPKLSP